MFPNIGIGVDLLHLPRLRSLLLARRSTYLHRFARRILTTSELATFQTKHEAAEDVVRWLGVRWAAKEAAFKAGGGGAVGRRLGWKEVEVRYFSSGQPYLQLERDGEGVKGGLSISHDGEYVVAMAMLPPPATTAGIMGMVEEMRAERVQVV
ncbi:4'-phosphopantetheinyl transferase superfamily [Trichophaea hybrida]|nr:4'-phosphopantetheinyl transferase superfamily [Trichophaea hybrida]